METNTPLLGLKLSPGAGNAVAFSRALCRPKSPALHGTERVQVKFRFVSSSLGGPGPKAPGEWSSAPCGRAPPPLRLVLPDGSRRPSGSLGSFRQRSRVSNVPPAVSRRPSSTPPPPALLLPPPSRPLCLPRPSPPPGPAGASGATGWQNGGLRDLELRAPALEAAAAGTS